MKAYKGFNRDMTCRGFQYEEGKTFHEKDAIPCEKGFHACENPLDTFNYYAPANSVFHEVDLDEVAERHSNGDTKLCAKTIRIGARLDVAGICKAHFDYVKAKCIPANGRVAGDKESAAAGEQGSAAAGYQGSAAAGNWGSAAAGERGIACCRGGKVKGGKGAVIVIAELDEHGRAIGVSAAIVDGKKIKADTWYTVKDGELVEAKDYDR